MAASADIIEALAGVRQWRQSQAMRAPGDVERRVAEDLVLALRAGVGVDADSPLWQRLYRVVGWAAAIRLAARAGNWPLTGGATEGFAELLDVLYRPLVIASEWARTHDSLAFQVRDEAAVAQLMADQIPDFKAHLADVERLMAGPGSVVEDLAAIARGDITY